MSDEKTVRDVFKDIINPERNASTPPKGTIGDFDPIDEVYLTDDSLEWLVGKLTGNAELHADKLELETNKGTFVFHAHGGTLIVEYENKNE